MTRPRIVIGTPLYGTPTTASVSWLYLAAVSKLIKHADVEFIPYRLFLNSDLVRTRSVMVRQFLEECPEATHLLFWDEDVSPHDVEIIHRMIALDLPIVSVPYPKKRIDWQRIAETVRDEDEQSALGRQTAQELEALGSMWPILAAEGATSIDERGLTKITGCGLGFTLMKREALQKLWDHYQAESETPDYMAVAIETLQRAGSPPNPAVLAEALAQVHARPQTLIFLDELSGRPCVALFALMFHQGRLWSEDMSFCLRAKAAGVDIHLYAEPVDHVGRHVFKGALEGLAGQTPSRTSA